jgi:hypothetical protein
MKITSEEYKGLSDIEASTKEIGGIIDHFKPFYDDPKPFYADLNRLCGDIHRISAKLIELDRVRTAETDPGNRVNGEAKNGNIKAGN